MAKVDILHRNGVMVTAKLHGKPWGRAEKDESLGWKIATIETDLSIRDIKSRCRVEGSELELLPEAEWRETIIAKQVQMAEVEADFIAQLDTPSEEILKAADAILRGDLTFDGNNPVVREVL